MRERYSKGEQCECKDTLEPYLFNGPTDTTDDFNANFTVCGWDGPPANEFYDTPFTLSSVTEAVSKLLESD